MFTVVVTLHIIVCIVLILVILLQAGRGAGLSNIFGGGGVQTLFGTSAATFLTRATTICAIIFLLTCLGLGIFSVQRGRSLMKQEMLGEAEPQPPQEEVPAELPLR